MHIADPNDREAASEKTINYVKEDKIMAMEISSAYNSYASTYTNGTDSKKQTESKAITKMDKANSSSGVKAGT